jgi:putative selenium metabolism hydrolase
MTALVREVEELNSRLRHDFFLGKGTVAVTDIRAMSPSLCAVPGACTIHLDRRLTAGETRESAVASWTGLDRRDLEFRRRRGQGALLGAKGAEVDVLRYAQPSYTGLTYPMDKYYPTWVVEESHPLVQAAVSTHVALHGKPPVVDKWTFSTNGVGSMGIMGVPTMGFGPGEEDVAHSVMERVPIRHLVEAAQFYAAFPLIYTAASG